MSFGADVLKAMGINPTTSPNAVLFIDNVWIPSEGGPPSNPLNIGGGPGTFDGGAAGTGQFIDQNSNFAGIVQAFQSNAPVAQDAATVIASPWASSHYHIPGGPETLMEQVAGGASPVGAQIGKTGSKGLDAQGCDKATCLVCWHAGFLFGHGPSICLISRGQAKALVGGLCIIAGGGTMLVGVTVLTAFAFRGTRAGRAAQQSYGTIRRVARVPGGRRSPSPAGATRVRARPDADDRLFERHVREQEQEAARTGKTQGERAREAMRPRSFTPDDAGNRRELRGRLPRKRVNIPFTDIDADEPTF